MVIYCISETFCITKNQGGIFQSINFLYLTLKLSSDRFRSSSSILLFKTVSLVERRLFSTKKLLFLTVLKKFPRVENLDEVKINPVSIGLLSVVKLVEWNCMFIHYHLVRVCSVTWLVDFNKGFIIIWPFWDSLSAFADDESISCFKGGLKLGRCHTSEL